jgi:hypothetical protein
MPNPAGKIAAAVLIGIGALAAAKRAYDFTQPALPAASPAVAPHVQLVLPDIAAPNLEPVLPEPKLSEIASSYQDVVAAASLRSQAVESEIIESEFIEPERRPTVTRRPVAQPAVIQPVREVPRVESSPPPEPRFDPRREREFLPPPPPPPRGMRAAAHTDFRPDMRRPPRR